MQAATEHHHKAAAHKAVHAARLEGGVADPPPFVGAEVRKGVRVEPLQQGPDFDGGFNGGGNFGGGNFGGGGCSGCGCGGCNNAYRWLGIAGVSANAIGYGVNVGTSLLAPLVNGVASNIPITVPALADGSCLRGQPIFLPRFGRVMCVVGNGAQVTNYMFGAANALAGAAGGLVGIAGQIASVAAGK
jgi:hypothetical protein